MGFKAIKKQSQQPQFCEYVQNKIDIARDNNSTYELTHQDERIQKLYSDSTLKPVDKIKSIARIKRVEDGAECLVVTKDVVFVDKLTGLQKDRYTEKEGLAELPLKITNEEGVTEDSQVRLEYDIPFSKDKVMEYVKKAGARGVKMRFYDGPETGSRMPSKTQVVGNLDFFINATWEELLMGKEMGLVSSMINKLEDVRKNMGSFYNNNTQQDTNKKEEQTIIQEEVTNEIPLEAPIPKTTGVKLKVTNTANKKD